jgi:hypothetical protein
MDGLQAYIFNLPKNKKKKKLDLKASHELKLFSIYSFFSAAFFLPSILGSKPVYWGQV